VRSIPRLCCVVVVAAVFLPAAAQTEFDPSVAAEAVYSDNLEHFGTSFSSDTAYRLGLDLPVTRDLRTGSVRFRYNARRFGYQDSGTLDHTDHLVEFSSSTVLGRKSTLTASVDFSSAQTQADLESLEDPAIVLTERTTRERFSADVAYGRQIGAFWDWGLSAGTGTVSHDLIDGYSSGLGGTTVEDRSHTWLSTSFGRQVSKRTNLGFGMQAQQNRLDLSGDEEFQTANLRIRHQLDPNNSLAVAIGGFSTSSEIPDVPDRTGVNLQVTYNRDFRRVEFDLFAGRRPTPGGDLKGTATNTNVGVRLAPPLGAQTVLWDLSAVYVRRDPADLDDPEIDTLGIRAGVTWLARPEIGVRGSVSHTQQSSDTTVLDNDVLNTSLGVVWFPRGRQRRNQE